MTAKQRALFLDRDGVINVDHGYVHRKSDFEFVEGIFDLCRAATALGHEVFVVTNQAGIGRGYYTESQFLELTEWMCGVFRMRGVEIGRVYHCPYHPEHGLGAFRQDAFCRKPNPGMILQAAEEYGLDLGASLLIGDSHTDIQAGRAAGVGCNILFDPAADAAGMRALDHAVVPRLVDAVRFIARECG